MRLKPIHTYAVLVHKESMHLERCILSLRNQTVKSNISIFTSTPSDFLSKISEKFHIPVFINKNGNGIASDWSFAYNNCATKYVTLAHQDDIYLPDYTKVCLSVAESEQGKDSLIVFTDYKELIENKIRSFSLKLLIKRIFLIIFFFKQNIGSRFFKKILLSFGTPIQCSSVMYNKERIGAFEFSKALQCNMDWDAWLRISQINGSFLYIKKKMMIHRIHKGSQSFLLIKNTVRKKEEKQIFEQLWPNPFATYLSYTYSTASKFSKAR